MRSAEATSTTWWSNLKKNKARLAEIATAEMGKAIKESVGEVEKCAWALEFYADHGDSFLTDEVLNTDARKSFLTFEPLGVIGSIMPWNFPYWQALRFAAPVPDGWKRNRDEAVKGDNAVGHRD